MFTDYNFMHFHISPIRSTCRTHLAFLDLLVLIIFGGEYKSSSFSLLQHQFEESVISHSISNALVFCISCLELYLRNCDSSFSLFFIFRDSLC